MHLMTRYVLPRIAQWALVIFVGITITFLIPRLSPTSPIDQAMGRLASREVMNPEAFVALRESLEDLYGLEGTLLDQYVGFWRRVLVGDLGPSFGAFPMPVTAMIRNAVGWTAGLLTITTVLAWLLGLVLGGLAGYFPHRWWSHAIDKTLIFIYPIPYYILAFVLLMVFAYYVPIFPLLGSVRGTPSWTLQYIGNLVYFSFLPAVSLLFGATAWRYTMSRALTASEATSDYVQYARLAGLPVRKLVFSYVVRNTMLPQITDLGLSLGTIFGGALITEVVFGYPGLGFVLYNAVLAADYNVIMGITLLSIIGISTASLLIDLAYPLFDPRVRYR
jgi:peptide/nickel transport system permease protein